MNYTPALDGLRCIAVIVVMAFHAKAPGFAGGFLGVDVFFVLSGYLITTILYGEITKTGSVNLPRFYAKRLARLYPALAICLGLYILLAPLVWPNYQGHARDTLLSTLYLADYSRAMFGVPVYINHLWSLSVEMHFYLIWPFIVIGLVKVKLATAIRIIIVAFLLATAWRLIFFVENFWMATYYRFDTRLSGLIAGSLLAIAVIKNASIKAGYMSGICGILLIIGGMLISSWKEPDSMIIGMPLAEIGSALLILYALNPNKAQPLAWAPLVYLGKLSYGMYLFHYPIMVYLRKEYDWQTALFAGGVASTILAAASYHTVENFFRQRKNSQASAAPTATD